VETYTLFAWKPTNIVVNTINHADVARPGDQALRHPWSVFCLARNQRKTNDLEAQEGQPPIAVHALEKPRNLRHRDHDVAASAA
jgi:hypothetical protein